MADTHVCHAMRCSTPVRPQMLMCRAHWAMVPEKLQRAVWRHYRRGQCDDKLPSAEWHEAADAAIRYVAMVELVLPEFYEPSDAKLWMTSPQKLLNGDAPIDIIGKREGWLRVKGVIQGLKDGVYV